MIRVKPYREVLEVLKPYYTDPLFMVDGLKIDIYTFEAMRGRYGLQANELPGDYYVDIWNEWYNINIDCSPQRNKIFNAYERFKHGYKTHKERLPNDYKEQIEKMKSIIYPLVISFE